MTKLKNKVLMSLIVQVAGEWSQMQLKDHTYLENTGSYVALCSLGTTAAFKGFTIPIMFSLPFYHDFRGEQNQNPIPFKIGLTKTF